MLRRVLEAVWTPGAIGTLLLLGLFHDVPFWEKCVYAVISASLAPFIILNAVWLDKFLNPNDPRLLTHD
jgi:hypothetical protein